MERSCLALTISSWHVPGFSHRSMIPLLPYRFFTARFRVFINASSWHDSVSSSLSHHGTFPFLPHCGTIPSPSPRYQSTSQYLLRRLIMARFRVFASSWHSPVSSAPPHVGANRSFFSATHHGMIVFMPHRLIITRFGVFFIIASPRHDRMFPSPSIMARSCLSLTASSCHNLVRPSTFHIVLRSYLLVVASPIVARPRFSRAASL